MTATKKSATAVDRQIGARVRLRRMLVGMSQTQLGDHAGGITFQQIQKYENGTNRIGAGRLHQIAEALGVPVEFFYEREGRPDPAEGSALARGAPELTNLLNSADTLRLVRAFTQIEDGLVRQRIVTLAETVAAAMPKRGKRGARRAATVEAEAI